MISGTFCEKLSAKILSLMKPDMDNHKKNLFDLFYKWFFASNRIIGKNILGRKI